MIDTIFLIAIILIICAGAMRGGMKDLSWAIGLVIGCLSIPLFSQPVANFLRRVGFFEIFQIGLPQQLIADFMSLLINMITFLVVMFVVQLLMDMIFNVGNSTILGKTLNTILGIILAVLKIYFIVWLIGYLLKISGSAIAAPISNILNQSIIFQFIENNNPLDIILKF